MPFKGCVGSKNDRACLASRNGLLLALLSVPAAEAYTQALAARTIHVIHEPRQFLLVVRSTQFRILFFYYFAANATIIKTGSIDSLSLEIPKSFLNSGRPKKDKFSGNWLRHQTKRRLEVRVHASHCRHASLVPQKRRLFDLRLTVPQVPARSEGKVSARAGETSAS